MKSIIITFTCLFLFSISAVNGQINLMPLDSIFLNSVDHFFEKADKAKSDIWNGMQLAPICLYRGNGPALLYNHSHPPENFFQVSDNLYIGKQKDLQLFGATQTVINGKLTAIVDYGHNKYSCIEELYAELFHELHHVYQRNFIKQIGFDNPAILMTYPENYLNDGLKLFEQKILYKMCFINDSIGFNKLLNQFNSSRRKRGEIIGDYLRYEETVESVEGPAFYCEYMFYNHFTSIDEVLKNNFNHKHFFGILTRPFYGRNSLRKRHLAAGMAMCLILDKHFDNWQTDYYTSSLSLYDFFISRFNPQKEKLGIDQSYCDISMFHTRNEVLEHDISLNKFYTQQGIKVTLIFDQKPDFKGFDPMNAESINDSTILHKTMLKLSSGDHNNLFINNKKVATIIEQEIWFVKKVVFFVPEDSIISKENRITINTEGMSISWTGQLKMKDENEIHFNCE